MMSMDIYDNLINKQELYRLLNEAEDDFKSGNEMSSRESLQKLRKGLNDRTT